LGLEKQITDEKTISVLKKAYGYDDFDILVNSIQRNQIIQSAKKSSKSFNEISRQLNLNNIRLFNNSNDGVTVVIFPYLDSKEKSFALKGSFSNGNFAITNEIFVEKININNQVTTLVSKDNESFIINSENDFDKFQTINLGSEKLNILDFTAQLKANATMSVITKNISLAALDDKYGNHGGNGFCQRERNETFAQCYKAEKDEFCDDFFSCIAGDLVPAVSILIATSCSCSASQSD
jgi:hypothetical protein